MKRLTLYIFVALVTFTIGSGISLLVRRTLPANITPVMTPEATPHAVEPLEFTPTAIACGLGYAQMYEMRDGRTMSEGSVCGKDDRTVRDEWRKVLATATHIVERVPGYKSPFGESGERLVARFPPDEFGRESTRIMWYDGGTCYFYISAPTLDIALEFERTMSYPH